MRSAALVITIKEGTLTSGYEISEKRFQLTYSSAQASIALLNAIGILPGIKEALLSAFGEHLLDRVEVGRVFGQQEQCGTVATDGPAHGLALVAARIVHDDDVAGLESRDESVVDVTLEVGAGDRPVEQPSGGAAIMTKCCREGHGFPSAPRHRASFQLQAGIVHVVAPVVYERQKRADDVDRR